MIQSEPRSPSDVVLNPFQQSAGSFSHGTAVPSFSSRHSRYTPDQGNSRRRSSHQPIRISVVGGHTHEATHPAPIREVESSKRPPARSFSSYLHAQSRRSLIIVACAMVSLCLLCFHSMHSSDSMSVSHASHLQSKQYNVKFVTPLKASFKQQPNGKPVMFTEIDAAKLWKAPALSVKPTQPLSTAARSEIQAQLNDLHAAAAAEQPIIDHTINATHTHGTASVSNNTMEIAAAPAANVSVAQPSVAPPAADVLLPVMEDDTPPAEEALFDTPLHAVADHNNLPVSSSGAATATNTTALLTKRITADDEEVIDVTDESDLEDEVSVQTTAMSSSVRTIQPQFPVLTTYQRELQMQQLKKSDMGARIGWETPSNATTAETPLFSSDILFVIATTSQHHSVVRESLLTWGQHLLPHLRVYSDRAQLVTEAEFPVNITVVVNPYASMTLANPKHRHSWRVHSIVADLQRTIAHGNTYKFVVFLPDLAFPLLDQISWRLAEYQRIQYSGDDQSTYPLFLSGKIATKQYDASLLLFKEQAATADKMLQNIKLTFSSPAVTGINLQMLSQLAGAISSCPVLATDELTLSALMHCAGVGSSDIIDGFNFFPSTRHNHREKGVVLSTPVADWRGVDLLQAYKNAKTVREAYEYYYGKLHSTHNTAVASVALVSARDAVLAAASVQQSLPNEPSHSSSEQMAIEAVSPVTNHT